MNDHEIPMEEVTGFDHMIDATEKYFPDHEQRGLEMKPSKADGRMPICGDQEEENPNTNCLEGMQCPKCGSYGPFLVNISVLAVVHDDGISEYVGDTDWDGESMCICDSCNFAGTVSDFSVPRAPEVTP